jgi:hypothetical protein
VRRRRWRADPEEPDTEHQERGMDQRPSSPSDDAWQPHEPGRPAGDVNPQDAPVPGAPDPAMSGGPERVAGWRDVSWQGVPGQGVPGHDLPAQAAAQPAAPAGPTRSRRLLAGAALATGLAVGGAGVAAAVTSGGDRLPGGSERAGSQNGFLPGAGGFDDTAEGEQSQPTQPGQQGQRGQQGQPGEDGPRGFGHHGHGGPRGFPGLGGPRGALHGELVVPQEDGTGTRTITVQSGSVTAVSATRLTVRSTDGFDATYVVGSRTRLAAGGQGISAVKVGHEVTVVATKSGSTLTAIRVGDRTLRQQRRDDRRDDDGPGQQSPSPSASPTTSGASA